MNEEQLKQILNKIGQSNVPPEIAQIAELTSQKFASTLNVLQTRQPQRSRFITGLRLLAAAAVIVFAFYIGLSVGQRSMPSQTELISLDLSSVRTHPAVQENQSSFWRQKAVAAMQPRPYAQTQFEVNAYKQYLKEKHYD
jgi:hypothetical protein